MNGKKLHNAESFFYLIFSIIPLVIFLLLLRTRLSLNVNIGFMTLTIFFVILASSASLAFLALRKSVKARYLFLEFIFILLVALIIELFLRMINFPPSSELSADQHKYNRLKTLVQLRQEGLNAMPSLGSVVKIGFSERYGIDLYFGDAGNSQVVGDYEDDGLIIYRTDANGFRNEPGLYEGKENFDVFLLGDSFAHGSWVPDGFTISDYIRKDTGMSVYNAGNGGSGLIMQLATFLEYGLQKKPKNVILLYVEAVAFNRALTELNNPTLKRYFEEQRPLDIVAKNEMKNRLLKDFTDLEYLKSLLDYEKKFIDEEKNKLSLLKFLENSKVLSLINDYIRQTYRGEGYPDHEKISAGRDIIKRIFECYKRETEKYGGRFAVVYLPDTRFYFKNWPDCEYRLVSSLCSDLGIPFVDLVKEFSKPENPRVFFAHNPYTPAMGGHCNRKGYELAANGIGRQLFQKKGE